MNATYNPTNETVTQSDDYSFAVSLYQITSCTNITASGIYLLSQNISGNQSNGRCIDIQANDTVLDCQGYWINGSDLASTYGIYANGRTNVTIKNCNVQDYDRGAYFVSSSYNIFKDVVTNSNGPVQVFTFLAALLITLQI